MLGSSVFAYVWQRIHWSKIVTMYLLCGEMVDQSARLNMIAGFFVHIGREQDVFDLSSRIQISPLLKYDWYF